MPEAVDLGYAVKLPPRRALRYFRSKDYHITGDWWELQKAAHAKAFTVAHAARTDILQSIRRQLTRGLQHGVSEAEFLRNMEPNLKQLGWWGKQVIVDKDGGAETVQLGSPQRLKTIFRTNMRTAYAHGRYRQQLENAADRPYWQYNARNDARTRASHAALDKVVFRYDDPFWDSHYPPNGFNCRCRVRALTRAQVNAGGLTPPPASQTCDLPDYTDRYDRRLRTAVQFYWPPEQQDWCWFKAQAIAESDLRTAAVSAAGAQGLLQIMPATWHDLQAELPQPGAALTVPANIIQGARYMARMQDVWIAQRPAQCRLELAQASYNAGAGHVLKAQGQAGGARCWDQIGPQLQQVTGHHARETIHYVARIGALRRQMP